MLEIVSMIVSPVLLGNEKNYRRQRPFPKGLLLPCCPVARFFLRSFDKAHPFARLGRNHQKTAIYTLLSLTPPPFFASCIGQIP